MLQIFTKKHRGFTLIELLVVIAIIGILASIVLVSLGGARTKAKDAAIKANMDSMRLAMEMCYTDSETLSYTGCDSDSSYTASKNAAEAQMPTGKTITDEINTADPAGTAYCIQAELNDATFWCVDSMGYSGTDHVCDAETADCAADI